MYEYLKVMIELGKRGMQFKVNNRVDVLDKSKRWLEARIIEVGRNSIKVTYKGFASTYDEDINIESEKHRVLEIGAFSSAHGFAKSSEFQ
jgi:hypothetical protein